jgi:hypothetical protein
MIVLSQESASMSYQEEMVSVDPGPEDVPTSEAEPEHSGDEEHPVVAGLEAEADDPATSEPLEHPQRPVGERPATGSVEKRG